MTRVIQPRVSVRATKIGQVNQFPQLPVLSTGNTAPKECEPDDQENEEQAAATGQSQTQPNNVPQQTQAAAVLYFAKTAPQGSEPDDQENGKHQAVAAGPSQTRGSYPANKRQPSPAPSNPDDNDTEEGIAQQWTPSVTQQPTIGTVEGVVEMLTTPDTEQPNDVPQQTQSPTAPQGSEPDDQENGKHQAVAAEPSQTQGSYPANKRQHSPAPSNPDDNDTEEGMAQQWTPSVTQQPTIGSVEGVEEMLTTPDTEPNDVPQQTQAATDPEENQAPQQATDNDNGEILIQAVQPVPAFPFRLGQHIQRLPPPQQLCHFAGNVHELVISGY